MPPGQSRRAKYTGHMPALRVDATDPEALRRGLTVAVQAIVAGESIVLPTDTVYGIGCDPFQAAAVEGLLRLKGRTKQMPPPVLVGSREDARLLAAEIPDALEPVLARFWPGGVTIIVPASPEVVWDLGDTAGTVALRMPAHDVALELLRQTGPLAVSSANLTGELSALDVDEAITQFGDRVPVYIDAGSVGHKYRDNPGNSGSTIIDATKMSQGGPWRVVRRGVVSLEAIHAVAPGEWAG
ncbi:MAG: L-threonylcarbamoyladenylate synthase [Pontimonas sp.]|jgi:L-threonylcarbamoyladenylate synthase